MKRMLFVVALCGLVSACATPARVEQMVAGKPIMASANNQFKNQVAVKEVTGGRDTNPMWTSQIGTSEFEQALEKSLMQSGLGASRQNGLYLVTADLLKLEQPILGIDMTVTAHVRYMVFERKTGKTVYDKTESIPYTAQFSDAFLGVERLKLANEGAARVNIEKFIAELIQLGMTNISLK